jgi:ABC-2 type transport system ATP-binding protein
MQRPRIEVTGLGKTYGQVNALVNVNLEVGAGTVLGVLGHNGAGKTTMVDILATRSRPTTGTAKVCGWDVVRFGHHVRRHIGMTSQFVALDDALTGTDNLIMIARLLGANPRQARNRSKELIEVFGLTEAAKRKAGTYSGGMKRRLDLAASLLGHPDVLFLDEPTTGLDPISRTELWDFVEKLASDGTTVVLTTQYLEEADRLADEVIVLAAGHIVAAGTPETLKAGIGKRTASMTFADPQVTLRAAAVLNKIRMTALADAATCTVMVPITVAGDMTHVVRTLDTVGVEIVDLTVTEPTLNDVYIALHRAAWKPAENGQAATNGHAV